VAAIPVAETAAVPTTTTKTAGTETLSTLVLGSAGFYLARFVGELLNREELGSASFHVTILFQTRLI
jgi:hypothetical protein